MKSLRIRLARVLWLNSCDMAFCVQIFYPALMFRGANVLLTTSKLNPECNSRKKFEGLKLKTSKWPMSCKAGIAVIILYCVFTFTSWALYPTSYNSVNNWLSDLGNSKGNPSGSIFYNAGCVLTGIALFAFFGGLYKWYTKEKTRKIVIMVAQVIGFLAALSLIMIGVFSEDYGSVHRLWSSIFFILNLMVIILVSLALYAHPSYLRPISYYGFIVAIINLLFVLIYDNPIFEWFTVFTALGFVGLLSYNMFKEF
jgi:hypothetical membrane protein